MKMPYGSKKQHNAIKFIEHYLSVIYVGECYEDMQEFITQYFDIAKIHAEFDGFKGD